MIDTRITYELVQVPPEREPVAGEIRYVIMWGPAPAESLAMIMPLPPKRIVWNGTEWVYL